MTDYHHDHDATCPWCGDRATFPRLGDFFSTKANVVTTVRTVGCIGLAVLALTVGPRAPLMWVSLLTYWVGDMLDGVLARRYKQETLFGAGFDIVCDRVCVVAVSTVAMFELAPTYRGLLLLFLGSYCLIDLVLSLEFSRFELSVASPNNFYEADRPLYTANWHRIAKSLNNAPVILIFAQQWWGLALAGVLISWSIKLVSMAKARHLGGSYPSLIACYLRFLLDRQPAPSRASEPVG
ncbi:MAG: CDP-alcohol phosphatidyltransferase family protein [Acidimicrobiales bacterium]|nr:CDP-alcohol phosphatidyltransferase family protein [Acidimicrobiales bacterium]